MANFELYQPPGYTIAIAIAQPRRATWERPDLPPFADGTPRRPKYARVVWQFPRLTEAQYQVFIANRPANGKLQFKTWRDEDNAYIKCAGVMQRIKVGTQLNGERLGVEVVWLLVEAV